MFAWPPGLIAGRFLFSGGGEWGLGKKASGQRNNSANESRHRAEDQHHVPFGCHLLRALVDRRPRHANICERLLDLINAGFELGNAGFHTFICAPDATKLGQPPATPPAPVVMAAAAHLLPLQAPPPPAPLPPNPGATRPN